MKQSFWVKLFARVLNSEETSIFISILRIILKPLSYLYEWVVRTRRFLYRNNIFKANHVNRCVVSIGNITVGGTGKTPVTILIAKTLLEFGYRVAIVSRGYKRSNNQTNFVLVSDGDKLHADVNESGDEPLVIYRQVPSAIIAVGANRSAIAKKLINAYSPDLIILDDGFSHLNLARDINLVMLESTLPFSNGWLLPAGKFREHPSALADAHYLGFTRSSISQEIKKFGLPVVALKFQPECFITLNGQQNKPLDHFKAKKIVAAAGIANPDNFHHSLHELGCEILKFYAFDDHYVYHQKDIAEICNQPFPVIITEKDAVKWMTLVPDDFQAKVWYLRMKTEPAQLDDNWQMFIQQIVTIINEKRKTSLD